jgi:hypothetical protein
MRGPELAAAATPRTLVSSVIRAFTGTLSSGSNRDPRPDVGIEVSKERSSENDPDLNASLPKFSDFRSSPNGESGSPVVGVMMQDILTQEGNVATDISPTRFLVDVPRIRITREELKKGLLKC